MQRHRHGTNCQCPFIMRSTCMACEGTRVVIRNKCFDCAGKGKIILPKTVTVPVPAGVEDGQAVRMPVNGQEIIITFKVAASKVFRRECADLHSDVVISLSQAVLGGNIRVPGIHGDIMLSVAAGTQSLTRQRLVWKGISRVNSYGYGDHYLHIKIKVPDKLSHQQRAHITAFAETDTDLQGTVNGVTGTSNGNHAMEDCDGFLAAIRQVLREYGYGNTESAWSNGSRCNVTVDVTPVRQIQRMKPRTLCKKAVIGNVDRASCSCVACTVGFHSDGTFKDCLLPLQRALTS